jgi:hypothetical protein
MPIGGLRHIVATTAAITAMQSAPVLATSIDMTTYTPFIVDQGTYIPNTIRDGFTESATATTLTITAEPNLPSGNENTGNQFFPSLAGDFTAQVTVSSTPGTVAGFYADLASGYAGDSYGDGLAAASYGFTNSNITTGMTAATSPVVLRLSRVGDLLSLAFADKDTAGFHTLTTLTGPNVTGSVAFDLAASGSAAQPDPGVVTFSNLNIVNTAPQDLMIEGGSAETPVELGSGTTSVGGSIGGDLGSSDFYSFLWEGGNFSAIASIMYATDPNFFNYMLCTGSFCSPDNKLFDVVLDVNNGWRSSLGGDLAAGTYTIGLSENGGPDPDFNIVFATPLVAPTSGVPEPSTWFLMVFGFALIGSALRNNRHRLPRASHAASG